MWSYLPHSLLQAFLILCFLFCVWLMGFGATRILKIAYSRTLLWLLFLIDILGVQLLSAKEPPGFRMLCLIIGVFWVMKALVLVEVQATPKFQGKRISFQEWIFFSLTWPGMRPELFMEKRSQSCADPIVLKKGLFWICLGVVFLGLARWIGHHPQGFFWFTQGTRESKNGLPFYGQMHLMVATLLLLPGLSLILHFGFFSVLTYVWQKQGVPCKAPFQSPLRSQSLSEFWSRRWNLAFSEMTAKVVYQPLIATLGKPTALFCGFIFSGFLHEIAISLPVYAGFFGPLFYFLLQGGLVLLEQSLAKTKHKIGGWTGRIWTIACLVIPLPLLFHPAFLQAILWPLIGI